MSCYTNELKISGFPQSAEFRATVKITHLPTFDPGNAKIKILVSKSALKQT